MKQDPKLSEVEEQLQPGVITRDGFLGDDLRPLAQIIDDDQATVNKLGTDHTQIAARLRHLMRKGREGLGTEVEVEGKYEVSTNDVRGKLVCPWKHRGLYPKITVYVRHIPSGEEFSYTALQIHLIGAHGFYQGKGSPYRLEPERLKVLLDL